MIKIVGFGKICGIYSPVDSSTRLGEADWKRVSCGQKFYKSEQIEQIINNDKIWKISRRSRLKECPADRNPTNRNKLNKSYHGWRHANKAYLIKTMSMKRRKTKSGVMWFCYKKSHYFNTSTTRHLSAGTPKKSFVLPILMPFYAQSYAFIGSKHSDYTAKA